MAALPSRSFQPPARRSSGSATWYCEIEKKELGPMDFRELRMLALDKKLLGHHQVWQEGNENRQSASSIMGLVPTSKKKTADPPPSDLSDDDPYATPKARTIADGPPGGLYLPHLRRTNFPAFLLVLSITIGLFYAGWKVQDPDTNPIIYSLAGLGLAFWFFLKIVYLHRAWEMMKMFGAQLDGSKAIRFLFIPIFNALWCFVALFGWARLWNRSVSTHPGLKPASKVWRPFFLLFSTLFLISQVMLMMYFFIKEWPSDISNQNHQIALGIFVATLFVDIVCWFQLSQSINFLAKKKS